MAQKSANVKPLEGPASRTSVVPGEPSAKKLAKDIAKMKERYGPELYQLFATAGTDQLGQDKAAVTYGVPLYQSDPYDDVARIKGSLTDAEYGQKVLTTDDLKYLKRKEDQLQAADFKSWIGKLYNWNDPAQRPLLMKVYPEAIQEQMETIEMQAELAKRLAKIRLYGGPQDQEDARLMYLIQAGVVKVPTDPLWQPSQSGTYNAAAATKRGLFSFNVPTSATPLAGGPLQLYNYAPGGAPLPPSLKTLAAQSKKPV
jgi:hypothetical protein